MKILESYRDIAKSLLTEQAWDRKFGEPLPTLEDVMKEWDVGRGVDPDATDANIDKDLMDKQIVYRDNDTGEDKTISVGGALKQGEDHPAYDDAKKMVDKGKDGEKEDPKGKALGKGDFERDFGGDTGTDADAQGEPPAGPREPEDSDEISTDIADDLADDFQDNYGDMSYDEYMEKGFQDLPNNVMDKLDQLSDDEREEVMDRVRDILDDKFGDSEGDDDDEETDESIIINGKKYRPIKESTKPILTEAPSWYKDGAKLVRKVIKKHRIKPISGCWSMSTWGRIAQKIPDRQEVAYSIKPNYEYVELYRSDRDQKSKKIAILAKKIVKDIKKAGMGASFDGDFSINYNSQYSDTHRAILKVLKRIM